MGERGGHRATGEADPLLGLVEERQVVAVGGEAIADPLGEVGDRSLLLAAEHDLVRADAAGGDDHTLGRDAHRRRLLRIGWIPL